MAEIQTKEREKPGKREELGLRPKPKRPGVRMDMTPMVDVAFLLLIFFMVTTVFRRPLAMEINMPDVGAKVEVPESNVMTMYVEENMLRYRLGKQPITELPWSELTKTLQENSQANPDLIILVKVSPEARYERMVDMMDVLDSAKMTRFSLVAMSDADKALLAGGVPAPAPAAPAGGAP